MASSAYPGAFHDMTLKDYAGGDQENYEHVIFEASVRLV